MECQVRNLQEHSSILPGEGNALQEQLHVLVLGQRRLEDILKQIHASIYELQEERVASARSADAVSVSDASWASREAQGTSHSPCLVDELTSGLVCNALTDETFVKRQFPEATPSQIYEITSVETLLNMSNSLAAGGTSRSSQNSLEAQNATRSRTSILYEKTREIFNAFPMHPNSKFRTSWDVLSLLLIVYESVMVPFNLVFHIESSWLQEVSNFMLVFWTADIFLNFVTGDYRKGCLIMELSHIWRYYLKSTFIPDLLVVIGDWMILLSGGLGRNNPQLVPGIGSGPILKFLRVLKLQRAMRLANMIKSGKIAQLYDRMYHKLMTYGLSGHFQFVLGIGKLMCGMLWLNHVGCCLWVAVGAQSMSSWYQSYILPKGGTMDSEELAMKYLLGFYWSMTSMVSGGSTMTPTNWKELLFVIFFVLCGLIVGGSIISSLAAMLMEFMMLNADHNRRLKMLRRYLFENKVDLMLAVPIERELVERTTHRRRLSSQEVEILDLLSTDLLTELWIHIFSPAIRSNQFFDACHIVDKRNGGFLKSVCSDVLRHGVHEPGARIFSPDTSADGAYVVNWGKLTYRHSAVLGQVDEKEKPVQEWDFVSEIAMWVKWNHCGSLEATSQCEVLTIKREELMLAFTKYDDIGQLAKHYQRAVHKTLLHSAPQQRCDLHMPVPHDVLVAGMAHATRVTMSVPGLNILRRRVFHRNLEALTQEILDGKCNLIVENDDKEKSVLRVVAVVVLRLHNASGQVLAQIGKLKRGTVEPGCTLPGTKIMAGQLPKDALEHFMRVKMTPLKDHVAPDVHEIKVERKSSPKYGIKTKYIRTIFHAELGPEVVISCGEDVVPLAMKQSRFQSIMPGPQAPFENPLVQGGFSVADTQDGIDAGLYCWMDEELFSFLLSDVQQANTLLAKWIGELDGLPAISVTADHASGKFHL